MKTAGGVRQGVMAVLGAAFLAALIVACYVTVRLFEQDYTATKPIVLEAPRAGLLMDVGADVKQRGVAIGQVKKIQLQPDDSVRLTLGIYPDKLHLVSADVSAEIVPPTVFGAKYVDLVPPASPGVPIAAGAVISARHVTVEINSAFSHLVSFLDAAKPADVARALSAVAGALSGNGTSAARLVSQANDYLGELNPSLDLLDTDLPKATQVSDNLTSRVLPGLIRVGRNGGVVSDTLVHSQATLAAVLADLTTFGSRTTTFLTTNRTGLRTTLDSLDPVDQLLAGYSSILPCSIAGTARLEQILEPVIGGPDHRAIHAYATLLPSDPGYRNPANLPVIGAQNAPSCAGLPDPGGLASPILTHYDTGANPYEGLPANAGSSPGGSALATTLFGALAGLVGTAGGGG